RVYHAADWERGAELLATRVELRAEQRCRERRVDEAGGDKADADRRELKRQRPAERGHRGGEGDDERPRGRPAAARSADEQERSARANLANGAASDVEWQPEFLVDVAARPREIDVGQPRVVRAAGSDQDVVDRRRQPVEEPLEALEVGGVEGCTAERAELACGVLKALGVAAGENDMGTLGPCSHGRPETDPRAAADHDDGLSGERRLAGRGRIAHFGSSVPACSAAMYLAYQSGQFGSAWPIRFSCSPWAAEARRIALARSFVDAKVVAAGSMRPATRAVISWNSQPLPSGSRNE